MWDPFYTEMPEYFGMKLPELLKLKDPHAWPDFERGEISEEELYTNFFKDRRDVNGPGLLHQMVCRTSKHAGNRQLSFRLGEGLVDDHAGYTVYDEHHCSASFRGLIFTQLHALGW